MVCLYWPLIGPLQLSATDSKHQNRNSNQDIKYGARSSVLRRFFNSEGATKVPRVAAPETLLVALPEGGTWNFLKDVG